MISKNQSYLFDFRFLVHHVFAYLRVKFADLHFIRMEPLVFSCCVKMPSTCWWYEPNFVSHFSVSGEPWRRPFVRFLPREYAGHSALYLFRAYRWFWALSETRLTWCSAAHFQPIDDVSEYWAGIDASSCYWHAKRCFPPSGAFQWFGILGTWRALNKSIS